MRIIRINVSTEDIKYVRVTKDSKYYLLGASRIILRSISSINKRKNKIFSAIIKIHNYEYCKNQC